MIYKNSLAKVVKRFNSCEFQNCLWLFAVRLTSYLWAAERLQYYSI